MEQNIFKEINDALENASDHIINLEQEVASLKKKESLSKKEVEDIIKSHKSNGLSVAAFTGNQSNTGGVTVGATEVAYGDSLGDITSDPLFTRNATTLASVTARTTTEVLSAIQFDGTGTNDLTYDASGITTAEPISFEVTITVGDPTSPNKFSWVDSNGGSGSNITILPGLAQTLSNGVDITFASATGHDTNDIFSFSITPSTTTGFYTNDDVIGLGYPGSGVKTVATDGAYNFNGVLNTDSGLISVQVYSDALGDYFTSVTSSKGYYNIQVEDIVAGNQVQAQFRDGIARFAVNDGTAGTLQLSSAGLLINDAYTLPTADGSAGQALLTDGAGQAYWGSAGGTPALNEYYIGFGSGSNLLTGSSSFTYFNGAISTGSLSGSGSLTTVSSGGYTTTYVAGGISVNSKPGQNGLSYAISAGNGDGTNKQAGNITITTGNQSGNATSPYFDLQNTREVAASGTSLATSEIWLRNHDGTTIIGDVIGTIGNDTKIIINDLTQLITVTNVPTHADDSAATTAGLTTGQLYKTTTGGSTFLKIVP